MQLYILKPAGPNLVAILTFAWCLSVRKFMHAATSVQRKQRCLLLDVFLVSAEGADQFDSVISLLDQQGVELRIV